MKNPMQYLGGKFVSPVFTLSLLLFCLACGAVQLSGGVGPCGPNSAWGMIGLMGYPVGALGMIVGFVLSFIRTCKHLTRAPEVENTTEVKK